MHISICIMKFQNTTHLTNGPRNGTRDKDRQHLSLVVYIKSNPQIHSDLLFVYSFYTRKGVTSFQDLQTVHGQVHDTFKGAARAMGLLEDDTEHRRCLQEAAVMNIPSQMQQLFASLMLFQTPSDIRALFDEVKEAMSEDYIRHDRLHGPQIVLQDRHIHLCLWDIDTCLRVHGKSISNVDFSDLPQLPGNCVHPQNQTGNSNSAHEREQGERMLQQLNHDQRHIHDTIVNAIVASSHQTWMDQQVQVRPFFTIL